MGDKCDVILDFIKRRFSNDCSWTSGNCYYFALILKDRFDGTILYDVINGHFVTLIEQYMYDWNGIVDNVYECCKKQYIIWDDFDDYDSYQKERIIQDCVL